MWECWRAELTKCQEISSDRMPWEAPDSVTRIIGYDALRALHVTLAIVTDLPTRNRLITVAADECDRAFGKGGSATPDNGKTRHLVRCADIDCHELFSPDRSSQRFHAPACRQRTFKRKQRAARRGEVTEAAPEA